MNFTWLVAGQFVYKLLSLVALILLARHVTVEEFGLFSYSLAYVGLFYALPDLGLSDLLVRETAKKNHLIPRYFSNFFVLKCFLALVTIICIGISAILHLNNITISRLILIFGIGIALESVNFLMKAVFQAHQQMRYEACSLIAEGLIRLLLVLWALQQGMGLIAVALAFFVSTFFGLIISGTFVNFRFTKLKFEFDRKFALRHLVVALPFAGLYLLGYINLKIDVVMLLHLSSETATGLYGAANRLIEPLLVIPIMLGISLAPVLSDAVIWKIKDIIYFLRKSISLIIILYVPIVLLLLFAAPFIFKIIFGTAYVNAQKVFRLLVWFFPLFALQISWEKLINGFRREWVTVGIYFAGALLNIILNAILIPRWDLTGAVIATITTQGLVLIWLFCFICLVQLRMARRKDTYTYEEISSSPLRGQNA